MSTKYKEALKQLDFFKTEMYKDLQMKDIDLKNNISSIIICKTLNKSYNVLNLIYSITRKNDKRKIINEINRFLTSNTIIEYKQYLKDVNEYILIKNFSQIIHEFEKIKTVD